MEAHAMFVRDGSSFVGTSLTSGGWDRRHTNGATVLALLGQCRDDVPSLAPMPLARLTTDLVRPVPVGARLQIDRRIAREGKKLKLVELRLCVDDVEHALASALGLPTEEIPTTPEYPTSTTSAQPAASLLPPEDAESLRGRGHEAPGFLQAIEMRRARYRDRGGSGCWVRLAVPVVADGPGRPTARLTFAFDCANQIGVEKLDAPVTMIQPRRVGPRAPGAGRGVDRDHGRDPVRSASSCSRASRDRGGVHARGAISFAEAAHLLSG